MKEITRKAKIYPLETPHRSYLLRLWRTGDPDDARWQASIVTLRNGKRLGFASLEELFTYLMDQTNYETIKGEK